jgi:heme o synthase
MASSHEEVATAIDGLAVRARTSSSIIERARAFYELGKPNLSGLVVISGILGFYLASSGIAAIDWWRFVHLIFGMALTANGACALNMVLERDLDALMRRTRTRPIPSGRVPAGEALMFAIGAFAIGFVDLAIFCGVYPALLSLVTLLIYACIYTPMKRHGPIAIVIGAIPGALPPVMGWTAVQGEVGAGGAALFAILFFWQFPHFLALAWMYRDDYARAGFRFLPRDDASGARTGRAIVAGCALLLVASILPFALGLAGWVYLAGALIAGAFFFAACLRVGRECTSDRARAAFLASVTYLPALLAMMVLDRVLQ